MTTAALLRAIADALDSTPEVKHEIPVAGSGWPDPQIVYVAVILGGTKHSGIEAIRVCADEKAAEFWATNYVYPPAGANDRFVRKIPVT